MMTNEKKYLADQIGEEYKSWKEGELIFIQAPTGTGKSYFILNVLLDWAVLNRFSILYLVNRKVLKSQIEEKNSRTMYRIGKILWQWCFLNDRSNDIPNDRTEAFETRSR